MVVPVISVSKLRSQYHAHRHSLAVGHPASLETLASVPLHKGLDRMGECMSEVQLATLSLLELVARHYAGLHRRSRSYQLRERPAMLRDDRLPCLEVILSVHQSLDMKLARNVEEKVGCLLIIAPVLDDECLEHLRRSGLEIPLRKALQHLRAKICEARLTDHAEDVLILVEVHPRLAADRRIHLRQKSRRHIRKPHSPLVDARRKPRHVRGYSASDSQHQRIPVRTVLQKPCAYFHHCLKRLGLLRRLDLHDLSRMPLEDIGHLRDCGTLLRDIPVNDRIDAAVRLETRLQPLDIVGCHDTAYRLLSGIYVYLLHLDRV